MAISTRFDLKPNDVKRGIARILDLVGVNQLGFSIQKLMFGPFIRAINYHEIRSNEIPLFEGHLAYFRDHYVPVDLDMLQAFIDTGEWKDSKPGLILSFDDGHRSHFDFAVPLLEKYGFKGWFFVPIGLMALDDIASAVQETDRIEALTLEHLEYLRDNHILGSHTITHRRLSSSVPWESLKDEIVGSQALFKDKLGSPVRSFCWVGGEEENYSREAANLIRETYEYSFMTNNFVNRRGTNPLQLQRTNVESENPLWLLRFQLSGVMDLLYFGKRRRVNRLTS